MLRSVLLFISIFGTAAASCPDEEKCPDGTAHAGSCPPPCGLPADVDPNGNCKTDCNGYSVVDMDDYTDPKITIEIKQKCEGHFVSGVSGDDPCAKDGSHKDAFNVVHAATVGTIEDKTAEDGRFVLSDKQGNGGQCITNTANPEGVTCYPELLSKGDRDSYKWQEDCKDEPLCTWKPGQKTIQITVTRPADYTEFGGEWVQMFKKDSWQNITNEYEPFTFNDYGSKIPLGIFRETVTNPTTKQILSLDVTNTSEMNVFMEMVEDGDYELKYGNPKLKASTVDDGLKWVAVEFKKHQLRVGNPFTAAAKSNIGAIFRLDLGDPNIYYQDHKNIAEDLTDAIAGVAGGVDVKVVLPIHTVSSVSRSQGESATSAGLVGWTSAASNVQCYKSGNACPEAHSVCDESYCSIERWNEIIADLKNAGAQVLGLIDAGKHVKKYADLTPVDGYYFGDGSITMDQKTASGDDPEDDDIVELSALDDANIVASDFTVCAIGAPLFDTTKVDKCNTWVTLAGADLGVWTPYSWFSSEAPGKWTAIVDSVPAGQTIDGTIAALFDRGYGYVFLGDGTDFNPQENADGTGDLGLAQSTRNHLKAVIAGIGKVKNGANRRLRGLQTQDDGVATTKYECDDTLFECQPVCMQTTGVTRTKVGDYKCSGEKPTHCSCRCYYDAYWTVEKAAVVCKASIAGSDAQTVGDLVCIARGTPKPKWDPTEERTASDGERKLDVQRMRRPTEQCLAEYAAESTEPAVKEVVETTQAPATTVAPVVGSLPELDLMGSAVSVAVGAALLALA